MFLGRRVAAFFETWDGLIIFQYFYFVYIGFVRLPWLWWHELGAVERGRSGILHPSVSLTLCG